jgi:hypothetical protein
MFTPIHFDTLRNSEFLQFFKEIIDRCKRFDVVALLIASRVEDMNAEVLKLVAAYNKSSGSAITELLSTLDKRRDEAITGIKMTTEGLTHSFEVAIKTAADLVFDSIAKHPAGIARLNYKAETTEINSLILEWGKSTELTAALATLGFTSWVEELDLANTLFMQTNQDRIDDKLETAGISFSDLRPGALVVYNKLAKGIAAHFELEENPEHLKLINTINLIIDEYNLILKRRDESKDDDDNAVDDGTDGE